MPDTPSGHQLLFCKSIKVKFYPELVMKLMWWANWRKGLMLEMSALFSLHSGNLTLTNLCDTKFLCLISSPSLHHSIFRRKTFRQLILSIFSPCLNLLAARAYPKFKHIVCLVWFIDPVAPQMNSYNFQILSTATSRICDQSPLNLKCLSVFMCGGDPAC